MEDFEQKYNELVEAARSVVEANPDLCKIDEGLGRLSKLLPEKESEDEKIRKKLVEYFNGYYDRFSSRNNVNVHWEGLEVKAVIAYLERIKEQKPAGANEEDKKIIEDIIHCLEYLKREDTEREYNGDHNVNPRRYTAMIDKLKSFL